MTRHRKLFIPIFLLLTLLTSALALPSQTPDIDRTPRYRILDAPLQETPPTPAATNPQRPPASRPRTPSIILSNNPVLQPITTLQQALTPPEDGDCPDPSTSTRGTPRILCFKALDTPTTGKPFRIQAVGKDPDDNLTRIALKKLSEPNTAWRTITCTKTVCSGTWNVTEQTAGSYTYIAEVINNYNQRGSATLTLLVNEQPSIPTFLFRTAARPHSPTNASTTASYISQVIVTVSDGSTNTTTKGKPFATFNVHSNTLFRVHYSANNFAPDEDYYYFDARLPSCQGNTCTLHDKTRTTTCISYLDAAHNTTYACRYENTANGYITDFHYTPYNDPLGDHLIHAINILYPIIAPPLTTPHTAPALEFGLAKITIPEGERITGFNLDQFVAIDGIEKKNLAWSVKPSPNIGIAITNDHTASFWQDNPAFIGKELVTFRVAEPTGNFTEDTLLVEVVPKENLPPFFASSILSNSTTITTELGRSTTFSINAYDRELDTLNYAWILNNQEVLHNSILYNYTARAVGTDILRAEINDGRASTTINWTIHVQDTTPPALSQISITPNPQARTQPVTFTMTAKDLSTITNVQATITNPSGQKETIALTPLSGGITYQGTYTSTIYVGNYRVSAIAEDTYGNTRTTQEQSFTIEDRTPPSITDLRITPSVQNNTLPVTISATVTDDVALQDIRVKIRMPNATELFLPMHAVTQDHYETQFNTTNAIGTYSATIIATDTANNTNDQTTAPFQIRDGDSPQITAYTITPTTQIWSLPVTITAHAIDNVAVDTVHVTITNPASLEQTFLMTRTNENYTYTFTNTTQIGAYTAKIIATDTANNQKTIITSFIILADTTPPHVVNVQATPNPQARLNPVTINATITDNVGVDSTAVTIRSPDQTEQSFLLTKIADVSNGGIYTTTIPSTVFTQIGNYTATIDTDGSSNNENNTVTTSFAIIDVIPPVILDLTITPQEQWQFLPVTFTANVSDDVMVQDVTAYILNTDENIAYVLPFSFSSGVYTGIFTNTSFIGIYDIIIQATDTSGNVIQRTLGDFDIKPDTQKPTVTILSPANNSNSGPAFTVNYTATDNVAVTSCSYTLDNGPEIPLPNCSTFTPTFTTIGFHTITVQAYDLSNNTNSTTITISVTDTTPPTILQVKATPATQTQGRNVTINTTATDNVGIATFIAIITYPNSTNVTLTLNAAGQDTFLQTFPATTQAGTYTVTVIASDLVGNSASKTTTFTITADTTPPSLTLFRPQQNEIFHTKTIPLQYSASDDGTLQSCSYTLNANPETPLPNCANTTLALGSGSYSLTLSARDTGDNTASQTVSFTVNIIGHVSGTVRDRDNGTPLENALMEFISGDTGQVVKTTLTSAGGGYTADLDAETPYTVRISKTGYTTRTLGVPAIVYGVTKTQDYFLPLA